MSDGYMVKGTEPLTAEHRLFVAQIVEALDKSPMKSLRPGVVAFHESGRLGITINMTFQGAQMIADDVIHDIIHGSEYGMPAAAARIVDAVRYELQRTVFLA